jgi:hypothetical protein
MNSDYEELIKLLDKGLLYIRSNPDDAINLLTEFKIKIDTYITRLEANNESNIYIDLNENTKQLR